MNNPIIQFKDLTKYYGRYRAVDDLNLDIYPGEIFGLLGPNGAGKTTSILMLLGLTEPNSGNAYVAGHNSTRNPIAVKREVGYLPDSVGFYDNMTGLENLKFIGQLNGLSEAEAKIRSSQLLEIVGLTKEKDKKTATYSRGMKQRLGLADVLIKNPSVIVLDEPTLGIDPTGVKDFLALIKKLSKDQGLTVLLSSHHLHHVQKVCDRVGIFVGGKLLAEGTIDSLSKSLFNNESYKISIVFKEEVNHVDKLETVFKQIKSLQRYTLSEKELEISCSEDVTADIVRLLVLNGYNIDGVSKKNYGLDDIYEKYFEENINKDATDEKSNWFFKKSLFNKIKK